jgi:hypothetical protein
MYKVHMANFNKSMETMSHLKFNVALVRAFINKGACFTPRATTMMRAYVLNPEGLHYFMTWT